MATNSALPSGSRRNRAPTTKMRFMMSHITTAFLILSLNLLKLDLAEASRQNPLKDPKICGRPQCESTSSKFRYADNLYKYDYNVELRTEFFGTGSNTSDLFVKLNLDVFFPKQCEGYLRINDVKLWDKTEETAKKGDDNTSTATNDGDAYDYYAEISNSEEIDDFANLHPKTMELGSALKKYVLRFAFHDGHIGEVCPSENEPIWVLNFKKGILSAFQNTMVRFDVDFNTTETDISGECSVQYSLESSENVFVTVRKVKDMTTCRKRYSTQSVLQTTPYTFRDDKTIWPILNSNSYCNMTIDNNIYREISCYERHQLIPFSNSSSGAVTTVKSKLELKGEETYSSGEFLAENTDIIEKRTPLTFDHTPAIKPTHDEIKAARELLKEMCSFGFPNIQREFIEIFTKFLQTTKSLDYKALTELLARAESICKNGKNHVLESLPYIGSTASYQVMRDQIIDNHVPKFVTHNWMTSLSFLQRPDEETLETFYTILEFSRKKIDPEFTLGASAVIYNFCKHNSNCESNVKVKRITNHMETEFLNLFNMYRGERRTRERMIVILKGLGNIGVVSEQFSEQLREIIAEEDLTTVDIRLQAVLAFRRVNCLKYRPFFLRTYGNFSVNSEVRIFSYLQTLRCPDYMSISVIKSILENEEINQVGSFVWSHLKNLAKSNSPVRIEAQGLLLNDDISDKFKMDIRKFSRNYEHSLFFDEYNFGTTTDFNLIFGTDSFLPRTATLNFTADLFGQSVNFFEFGLRAEGFEDLVVSVFGPKGPLNREVLMKKLSFVNKWLGEESSEENDVFENILNIDNYRFKRAIDNETLEIGNDYSNEQKELDKKKRSTENTESRKKDMKQNINKLGYKLKYNYNQPRAQFGLRIFGNDIRSYTMEGLPEVMSFLNEFDPFNQASKILSGNEFTYTKSRVFLDASYNVPLGIGLPLSIHAFGASSVDFRVSGSQHNLKNILEWDFDVEAHFKPSVSVDVITTMQSDLFYALSGIKVKSNLYSNSEVEAKLKVRAPNLVSLTFNLPQQKNEIFSARSELLVIKNTEEIAQNGITNRRSNTTCSWPVLDQAIGLQLCSFFSVPDLSNASNNIYPGLLLSGPLNFSVVLTKSDLSAKKYVFEYKWDEMDNNTNWSVVFHTPGSVVKRLLVTNVTTVAKSFNASVSFVNGAMHAAAGCSYDGNPDKRRLDVFLDNNGNRSLNLNMELLRQQDRNIWIYNPKMLLAINGVNITGLIGTIRKNEKNGITQNDFDLSFETRKLQALLRGNIVQSEITTSTNMTINYRFQANKIETINFEGKLVNTGDKSKTEYRANVQLRTSAYPKLNFASNGTWLSLQGHTEGTLTYNNAPDLRDPSYSSSVRLIFARSYSEDRILEGSRTRASFEVKVPRSKVDFRILIKHEERNKNGSEHNFLFGLRYMPEKEATGLFSVHLPRRNLFAVDAYMNVSVPDFDSCTARLKIMEIMTHDYNIFFNGSWFTGHSIAIKGNYKDRSSRIQALHQLKLIVESQSFNMTSVNIRYRRNQMLVYGELQAKYGSDPYEVNIKYIKNPDNRIAEAGVHLKIKDKFYSVIANVSSEQPKLLEVEIHLDKLRDIHVKLGLLSIVKRKELSLDLKWDSNRDPSQRLGLLAELNNPISKRYDGNLMVTYPDRTVSISFDTFNGGPTYFGTTHISWSINDLITFRYNAGIMPGKILHNWIHADLLTPFEGWRRNRLAAEIYNSENLILANTTLVWADTENLQLGYKSDYEVKDPLIRFDIAFGMNSTVRNIPTIGVKVNHWQNMKNFDTELDLRYTSINETLNVYSMKSHWELLQNTKYDNLTGTVSMVSPFEGYRKGGLAAKFMFNDRREVIGAASLTFDIREFSLLLDGYVKKFTDNMLTINITTPLEKFRTINGRFGLNEHKRHAVAEVRSADVALGAEVLCDLRSLMSFDVRLSVATPIESFEEAGLYAKLMPDEIDMRARWNNTALGFTGVWRMTNITDFEYSYQVFTPLKGFEHNGLIAKIIKKDMFVVHLHGKLSHYKLGVKINGQPKSQLDQQLGVNKIELLYDEDFKPPKIENEEDYEDYDDYFSYFVDFEIDPLVMPTIYGFTDIQEVADVYLIVANIHLPNGRVDLIDRLYYPDYINVLNVLTVSTPFEAAKEIKSIVEYHVDLDFNYFRERIQFIYSDGISIPSEAGFAINYTKTIDPLKPRCHDITLNFKTPYEVLSEFDIIGKLELEDNIYRGNISSKTENTFLSLAASVETEDNFLETSVGILLETNVVPHYACYVYFKKDLSDTENSIDIQFKVMDNGTVNELQIESSWKKHISYIINANGKVRTTMLPLKLAESSIYITKDPNPQLNFDLGFLSRTGKRIDYGTRANKKRDLFNVEIWTPMKNYRNISMHGTLLRIPSKPNQYTVTGNLYRNMITYALNGYVHIDNGYPVDTKLRIQPKAGGRDGVLELSITEPTDNSKGLNVQFSAVENGKMCQISAGYRLSDKSGVDISVLVQSTEPEIERINFIGKLKPGNELGQYTAEVELETPWKELGIEKVHLNSEVSVNKKGGKIGGEYHIDSNVGRGNCAWSWILAENMQLMLESYIESPNAVPRKVHVSAKYLNPDKSFQRLVAGGKLNVDSKWSLEINTTANYRSNDDFQAILITQLPEPVGDLHFLSARYRGNLLSKQGVDPNVFFEGKYNAEQSQHKFLTRLSYRNVTDLQGLGHVEWGTGNVLDIIEGDFQMLRKLKVRREFYAKLITPKFKNEDTFFLNGNYDLKDNEYHNLVCALDYPSSHRIANMDVAFKSLSNMHGYINSTTPFLNVTWFKADFNFTTNGGESYRFCNGTWPTNNIYFKQNSYYDSQPNKRSLKGVIEMEIPLATRHRTDINYGLTEAENVDIGHVKVVSNEKQILDGHYKRRDEQKMPWHIETTDILLENEMKPLGIHYTNKHDPKNSLGALDIKHIEVFELRNTENFNLTGELHTRSTLNAQEFKIVAIHPNRTVTLTSNYETPNDSKVMQSTKLELSKTAWIGYNLEISNYSTVENETQKFWVELFYPRRNLSTTGWYSITEQRFDSDINFKWNSNENKNDQNTLRTALEWQAEPLQSGDRDHQTFFFTLSHPLLEKDVEVKGTYYRGHVDLLRTNLTIDYSNDPMQLIALGANLKNHYNEQGYTNYTFNIFGNHKASELDMQLNGTIVAKQLYYKTETNALYKRDYFPEKHGQFLVLLDLNKKEIEYLRMSPYRTVRLWAMPTITHPLYALNATVWDTPDTNNTGYMVVNVHEKYVRMEVNLTEDSSQNIQMEGYIPDTRSGYFDIWRNYDEIRIIDVSSYLKMNHSRLITGRFHWRPKIRQEIKEKINSVGTSIYNSFSEGIEFWIKSLYSESVEAIGIVWETVKVYNRPFLEDVGQLSVLEEDLDELRHFVNQSYEANDFYIKTVVNFTLTVLDELALRDHIESLPKIFTELWQAMGDSGKALRNSIVWLIETIKNTYNKMLDGISRFFHGESLHYLSALLEKGVEKYDKFVKGLHISFIKYFQNLWNKFWHTMSNYWKNILKRFEPHIFKLMSFIEATVWNLSKEVFDFIYKRTNELAESAYLSKVSIFAKNAERLYKDIMANDAITNLRKYSTIAWNFIKEKYFKLVPFGEELNEVMIEILDEIKELKKIEQVQFFLQKLQEVLEKLEWISEELQLEDRFHQFYTLLLNKFRNYALNALETADMYREAKTKFIFDPEMGVIDLEQKLPMSWHAFNETPKFEEIPEYKWFARAQKLISTTNSSLILYMYNLRTNFNLKAWLPPYYSRALFIDSRYIMTFDKQFVTNNYLNFERQCSYLLTHDFFFGNFTIILEPTEEGTLKKLNVIANNKLLEIDLSKNTLSINSNSNPMLPTKLDNITIYREFDILSIYSDDEFSLHCNMQYDLCWFEASNWYFGQTAGLFGTMNNERFDEFTMANHQVTQNVTTFAQSWSISHACHPKQMRPKPIDADNVTNICNNFFKTGMLSACVDAVDVSPFYEMCLDLGSSSTHTVHKGHPANKGACTAALAYIEACAGAKIPMRVPDHCVYCQTSNGSYVSEGTFFNLTGSAIPRSNDIVFIIEAKLCNENLIERKNIMHVVSTIEEQLQTAKIINNRYAVVAFGGSAPFDKPHTLLQNNRYFVSDYNELRNYFEHINVSNGTSYDIVESFLHASKLNFRPGVSKTFILLSCSNCAARHMNLDYTSILQYLLEHDINLHILADTEFEFEKTRKLRHFFGLDRDLVFSKRFPEGDAEIRKQLYIPKSNLGICTPLALETNGSIFSARKLMPERKYPIKRLATIFAKRIAKSALQIVNKTCECTGDNTGVSYVECAPSVNFEEKADLLDYDLQFNDWDWSDEDEDM